MILTQTSCRLERHNGKGPGGALLCGALDSYAEYLTTHYAGQVQTIYLDPPSNSGTTLYAHQCFGPDGRRLHDTAHSFPFHTDRFKSDAECLSLLQQAIRISHTLLKDDGSIFVHICPRLAAKTRLLMDSIFGEEQFVNEIVWCFQSGGRNRNYFSHSHDIILFYQKKHGGYLNLSGVSLPRSSFANNMRRSVDEHGRSFRVRRTDGKEIRYYEDDPVFPGDVWSDVSHLHQSFGLDSEKPLRLLERILLCSSRPGDLVADLFAGSGVCAAAAAKHGRRFLALDQSPLAVSVARKRLWGYSMEVILPLCEKPARLESHRVSGLGYDEAVLDDCCFPDSPAGRLEWITEVDIGYLHDDVYVPLVHFSRSSKQPELPKSLEFPVLSGKCAILCTDCAGRRFLFHFPLKEDEHVG